MKGIVEKILWKIQMIATTKLYELFFWISICGFISWALNNYIYTHYNPNYYFFIFITVFVYYTGYKIILE